jgi:hypothetical protein
MSRTIRTFAAAAAVAAALAAAGTASGAPPPGPAEGSVGPGVTSNLTMEHKKAKRPTHRVFRITNVRANASAVSAGAP